MCNPLYKNMFRLSLLIALVFSIISCGGGGGGGTGGSDGGGTTPPVAVLSLNTTALTFTAVAGSVSPIASQSFIISNSGETSTTLNWSVTENATWLTVTPISGSIQGGAAPVTVIVTINDTSTLAVGNHLADLIVRVDGIVSKTIPVTLKVEGAIPATSGSVFIGGTAGITQLSSLLAARAAISTVASGQPDILSDAKVTVQVIKADGTKLPPSFSRTDANGAYAIEVNAQAGDTVTVTIEKDGFTSLHKTILLTDAAFASEGDRRQLTISGNLAETTTIVAPVSTDGAFKAGGGTGPGFSFGLMRKASGERVAFSSRSAMRAASSDGMPDLQINIPQSWAPGATAVTAQLAAFNPANSTERSMFPGAFVGTGGSAASAAVSEQQEYQLESVAFFESRVTPNNGQPLVAPPSVAGATKAAVNDGKTLIYKWIPAEGCGAMQKYQDRDPLAAGVQVPIYTYNPNTGKWGYLGEGTIKRWDGASYTTIPAGEVVDTNNGGKLSKLACGTQDYYFEIVADEWYTWWNLDYPLLFTEPKTICLTGRITDSSGAPIPGAFVEADGYRAGGSSYFYTYAGNDGSFSLDIILGDNETLANYAFTAYNYSEWPAASKNFTTSAVGGTSTTSCNALGNIVIPDRLACRIAGRLVEETAAGDLPLVDTWLMAQNSDYSYYNWSFTAADGTFSFKSSCNEPITLWIWNEPISVIVNGKVSGSEQSDSGAPVNNATSGTVTLKDFKKYNAPPQVYSWIDPNPGKVGQTITLDAWAWDYENDLPLTYEWKVSSAAGVRLFTEAQSKWTPAAAGSYEVTLLVKDSKGNAATKTDLVEVSALPNNAPVVLWSWVQPGAGCNGLPAFYINAYDPDGDPLTYSADQGNLQLDPLSGAFIPQSPVSGNVTVTVSDNKGASTRTVLSVPPAAAGVQLYYARAWPVAPKSGEVVELYAYADEGGAAIVSYNWTVLDPDGLTVSVTPGTGDNSSVTFTPGKGGEYQIHLSAVGICDTVDQSFLLTASSPSLTRSALTLSLAGSQTVASVELLVTLPSGFTLPTEANGQPVASALQLLIPNATMAVNYQPEVTGSRGKLIVGIIKSDGFAANNNILMLSRVFADSADLPALADFVMELREVGDLNGVPVTGATLSGVVTNSVIEP